MPGPQQDMTAVLVEDHRAAERVFRELERGGGSARSRRELVDHLIAELVKHTVAEEQYLNPAVRQWVTRRSGDRRPRDRRAHRGRAGDVRSVRAPARGPRVRGHAGHPDQLRASPRRGRGELRVPAGAPVRAPGEAGRQGRAGQADRAHPTAPVGRRTHHPATRFWCRRWDSSTGSATPWCTAAPDAPARSHRQLRVRARSCLPTRVVLEGGISGIRRESGRQEHRPSQPVQEVPCSMSLSLYEQRQLTAIENASLPTPTWRRWPRRLGPHPPPTTAAHVAGHAVD